MSGTYSIQLSFGSWSISIYATIGTWSDASGMAKSPIVLYFECKRCDLSLSSSFYLYRALWICCIYIGSWNCCLLLWPSFQFLPQSSWSLPLLSFLGSSGSDCKSVRCLILGSSPLAGSLLYPQGLASGFYTDLLSMLESRLLDLLSINLCNQSIVELCLFQYSLWWEVHNLFYYYDLRRVCWRILSSLVILLLFLFRLREVCQVSRFFWILLVMISFFI